MSLKSIWLNLFVGCPWRIIDTALFDVKCRYANSSDKGVCSGVCHASITDHSSILQTIDVPKN